MPTLAPWLAAGVLAVAGCTTTATPRGDQEPSGTAPESIAPPAEELAPQLVTGELAAAEIATVGYDRITGAPVVLLRELDSGRVVPIWVGDAEARAIAIGLHGLSFPRPMTHDLLSNLLDHLGATLEAVVVRGLENGTYLGALRLRVEGREEPLWVDSRPSDALALAVRTGAGIQVATSVLESSPEVDFLAPEAADQVVHFAGLTLVAATPERRAELDLPDRPGLVVTRAEDQAAELGIERGDFVVEVAGEVPTTPLELLEAVRDLPAGSPLPLIYWRAGEEHEVELVTPLSPRRQEEPGHSRQVA